LKKITRLTSYLELPGTLHALAGLDALRTTVYVKYMGGEGFDLSVSELQKRTKDISESALSLQYITVKIGEEKVLMDFEFEKGQSKLAFEEEYAGLIQTTLHEIEALQQTSLAWFLSPKQKKQLASILSFETGRFLARCVDKKGGLWDNPAKHAEITSQLQASITILALAQTFTGSPFGATMMNNLCKHYDLRIDELRQRDRKALIREVLTDLDNNDKTVQLVRAVLGNSDHIINLLKVRKAGGYWTLSGTPYAPMTAVAYETSILVVNETAI
jgi:hypothetical protein